MGQRRVKEKPLAKEEIATHFNRALQEKVMRDRAKYMRVFKDTLLKKLSEDGHDFAYDLVVNQLKEEKSGIMREVYVDCLYHIAAQSIVRSDLRRDAVVNMIVATEKTMASSNKDKMYDSCSDAISCVGDEPNHLTPKEWTDIATTIIKTIDPKSASKEKQYQMLHALRNNMERHKEKTPLELESTQEMEELLDRKIAEIGGNITDITDRRTKGYCEDVNILADLSYIAQAFMYEYIA